jgi:ABC-2 type transport system ATP-binding protein
MGLLVKVHTAWHARGREISTGSESGRAPAPAALAWTSRGDVMPDSPELAIETKQLVRRFGELVAVAGIDLAVPRGSFYGFLGPNGAGKSTTIKCLTGLLAPSSGSLSILGLDPRRQGVEIKRRVGVVPEDLALFDRLSGAETLQFVGRVHGLDGATLEARAHDLLELMDLQQARNALASDYSHGMRKKLALAVALLPAPRLLFLDEPFEGIDAIASREIRTVLGTFVREGGTIFLTSHILEVVERLCDHIGVIHQGRLVAQGSLASLQEGGEAGRTLEEIFVELVGGQARQAASLQWLKQ